MVCAMGQLKPIVQEEMEATFFHGQQGIQLQTLTLYAAGIIA